MNILDLHGPEFLRLFGAVVLVTLPLCICLRLALRAPGGKLFGGAPELEPYEVAYLGGAETSAIDAAIARLVHAGILNVQAPYHSLTRRSDRLPADAHRLERAVHSAVADNSLREAISNVRLQAAEELEPIRNHLQELGLIMPDAVAWAARFIPLLLFLCVPLFGAVKVAVGFWRGRPVGFLIVGCLLSMAIAFIAFGRRVHPSRRGDRALAELKSANAALKIGAVRRAHKLAGHDLILALGLFGTGILAAGPLAKLVTALKPDQSFLGRGGGGEGGGGCGGGGGGGGGCGGCGG